MTWLMVSSMCVLLIYSCSENQSPINDASADLKSIPPPIPSRDENQSSVEEPKIDTCSIDVYITEKDFNSGANSVKEKLILQYEYCKLRYAPKVILQEDSLRKCTVYHQVWPPITIKAQLFAKRSDKKPYRSLIYQVQKEKEIYRIDEKEIIETENEKR
jgi:hypothetical protein